MTKSNNHEILNDFGEGIRILSEVKEFAVEIGKKLELFQQNNRCLKNVLIFTYINNQNINCIYGLIKKRYWSQIIVLLRWHLEMVHKSLYLLNNPKEYVHWLKGKKIEPKDIGKYFIKSNYNPKKNDYKDWSDIVHFNYKAFRNYPVGRGFNKKYYTMFINRILFELVEASHKANHSSISVLKPYISIHESNMFIERYNDISQKIVKFGRQYVELSKTEVGHPLNSSKVGSNPYDSDN